MSEKIIVRQTKNYETVFSALDPGAGANGKPVPVSNVNGLSPYGMVLAGLGTCTAFVVNAYAERHGIAVNAVELRLDYGRTFKEDCDHCEEIDRYEDRINMVVGFEGTLTPQELEKLFKISLHCPVHKMLKSGIRVQSRPERSG